MAAAAIIQARMTSTRFPGKVLAELDGQPMLSYMLKRVLRSKSLAQVVVATTTNDTDAPIIDLCDNLGVRTYRGDEFDVLGRYAAASEMVDADILVRLTADCPLMDPLLIDHAVNLFQASEYDYLSNAIELTYPDGLDIEVFAKSALLKAHREATLPFHREHVTPYMRSGVYTDIPTGEFRTGTFSAQADFSHLRWTVDTSDDLRRIRALVRQLPDNYGWMDALSVLTRRPEIMETRKSKSVEVNLRTVAHSDADLLFEWVNFPDNLVNKLETSDPIPRSSHETWLGKKLKDQDTAIWIGMVGDQPVGQVRLERRGDALEVDIFVAVEGRGRGIALAMLDAVQVKAAARWPNCDLLARVKPENWASRHLFAKAGYGKTLVESNHLVMRLVAGN